MMQSPAAVKFTVPPEDTVHAWLDESAENVTAPPDAVACTVYYGPLYVGLLGCVLNTIFCGSWLTVNDCALVALL